MGQGNFDPTAALADSQIQQMTESLSLTEEQQTKIREIMQGDGGMEDRSEQMRQIRGQQDAKMKSVLTDEQWQKYQAQQEEQRSRRGQGGFGGPRSGQRPN